MELKERRKRMGLTQAKLASFLEIDLATFEHIEVGSRPIPKTKIHKFNMFRRIDDEDIILAIYNGRTITQKYRQLAESEGGF